MYPLQCKCGEYTSLPNVLICPFCHTRLDKSTDAAAMKHLRRCVLSISPRVLSKRGPGRPPKQEYAIQVGLSDGYKRRCTNCGFYGCEGGVDGSCERWVPMILDRCPFCGRSPEMYPINDGFVVECGECNMTMFDTDRERLIAKWNRV